MSSKVNRGFAPIYILVVIIFSAIVFVSYSYVNKNYLSNKNEQVTESAMPSSASTASSTPTAYATSRSTIKATTKPTATSTSTNAPSSSSNSSIPKYIPTGSTLNTATSTPVSTSASSTDTSGTISVSTSSVNVTLSRANAQNSMIYGSGFSVTSQGATGWQIKYNQGTQGQGFYESSGGISAGGSQNIRSYINTNKANGVYTGSAVVEYYKNGAWQSGPTVSYTITLTD